jgi:DNA replication protein DnaC
MPEELFTVCIAVHVSLQIDWTQANRFKDHNDKYTESIQSYLKKFGEDFALSIRNLLERTGQRELKQYDEEVLHHARYARQFAMNVSRGLEDMKKVNYSYQSIFRVFILQFKQINEYLESTRDISPFVITGPSGSGKSTLMANIAKTVGFRNTSKTNFFFNLAI